MLIGLNGLARSGKDTFGAMLAEEMGFKAHALASPLKEFINKLFGWDERMSDGVLKEEDIWTRNVTSASLDKQMHKFALQLEDVGYNVSQWCGWKDQFLEVFEPYNVHSRQYYLSPRKAYQLFGTEFARDCISTSLWTDLGPRENAIWTDVRFPNEAEALLESGGRVIRILRPGQDTIGESGHPSEAGIGDVEVFATVVNDGTLQDLRNKVKAIAAVLRQDDEQLSMEVG